MCEAGHQKLAKHEHDTLHIWKWPCQDKLGVYIYIFFCCCCFFVFFSFLFFIFLLYSNFFFIFYYLNLDHKIKCIPNNIYIYIHTHIYIIK